MNLRADLNASKAQLMLDGARVYQVLPNLISNAIQASKSGEEVSVRTSSDNGKVVLEVSDNGCGIRHEDRAKVFQPFFSTKKEGTGLGVAVSKKIIDAHGRKIEINQNSPRGTTFRVTFEL